MSECQTVCLSCTWKSNFALVSLAARPWFCPLFTVVSVTPASAFTTATVSDLAQAISLCALTQMGTKPQKIIKHSTTLLLDIDSNMQQKGWMEVGDERWVAKERYWNVCCLFGLRNCLSFYAKLKISCHSSNNKHVSFTVLYPAACAIFDLLLSCLSICLSIYISIYISISRQWVLGAGRNQMKWNRCAADSIHMSSWRPKIPCGLWRDFCWHGK